MGKGRPAPSSEGVAVLVCACQDLLGPGHRQRYRATARPSACRGARRHAACRDLLRLVDLGRKEGRPAAVGVIENHEFAVDFGDVFLFAEELMPRILAASARLIGLGSNPWGVCAARDRVR